MTNPSNITDQFNQWKTSDKPFKILKQIANKPTLYQLSRDELGPFDENAWLQKIHDITITNPNIGIGDDKFTDEEKYSVKKILMFINEEIKQITFAYDPIQQCSDQDIDEIIKENHDKIGHPGIQKTYERIRNRYKIPLLMDKIKEHIETCDTCQTSKLTRIRPKEEPQMTDTPIDSNEKIAMDILGPLQKTKDGYQYILSIHDELTKYLILVPLKNQTTETIWDGLLNHYIYVFSAPKKHLLAS